MKLIVKKDVVVSRHGPVVVLDHALERIDLGAQSIHGRNDLFGIRICLFLEVFDGFRAIVLSDERARASRNRIRSLHQVGKELFVLFHIG